MADLPDVDTDNVGFFAYLNVLDHGASSCDPADVLETYAPIESFDSADNGFDATIAETRATAADITVHLRVKTDGWFVCWIDDTETFGSNTETAHGLMDIFGSWYESGYTLPEPVDNLLAQHIEGAVAELSNAGDVQFTRADIGLYCYNPREATHATLLAESSLSGLSGELAYHDAVTPHYHTVAGNAEGATTSFEGTVISDTSPGLVDCIAAGLGSTAAALAAHSGGAADSSAHLSHLFLYEVR